ncbi:hypothetical protein M3Y99_01937900 [Aphelenchoides fujianensis]|nr:hypothetical protein M3Y99_01937900 [Aphelenchoides fujianensis]
MFWRVGRRQLSQLAAKHPRLSLVLLVLLLLGLEEWQLGVGQLHWHNRFNHAIYRPITVRRAPENRKEIAIVSIVYDRSNVHDYELAQRTFRCYARLFGYPLVELVLADERDYRKECPGKDFMFVRHCVLARLMEDRPSIEWFVFIDADMGVVNPNHLLEEFVDERADLIFYDRLYNYEIMAGSYIARNTPYARSFLRYWAEYERRVLPGSFHGTDNGAIQEVFLDQFCSNCSRAERRRCTEIWHQSKDYKGLFLYESCARAIMGARTWYTNERGSLLLLSHARGYWARDCTYTNSRWSTDDFVLHEWKEKKRMSHEFFGWFSPFAVDPADSPAVCNLSADAHLNWAYKDTFFRPVEEIRRRLVAEIEGAYAWHLDRVKAVQRAFPLVDFEQE